MNNNTEQTQFKDYIILTKVDNSDDIMLMLFKSEFSDSRSFCILNFESFDNLKPTTLRLQKDKSFVQIFDISSSCYKFSLPENFGDIQNFNGYTAELYIGNQLMYSGQNLCQNTHRPNEDLSINQDAKIKSVESLEKSNKPEKLIQKEKVSTDYYKEAEQFINIVKSIQNLSESENEKDETFDDIDLDKYISPQATEFANEPISEIYDKSVGYEYSDEFDYKDDCECDFDVIYKSRIGNLESCLKKTTCNSPNYRYVDKIYEPLFYSFIKSNFEFLFSYGNPESILTNKIARSKWVQIKIDQKIYTLGKIYNNVGQIKLLGIGVAVMHKKFRPADLGNNAFFVRANEYDNFGFYVLLQSAETGSAIKFKESV